MPPTRIISGKQTVTHWVDEIITGLHGGQPMQANAEMLIADLLHLTQPIADPSKGMENAPLAYGCDDLGVSRMKVQKMVGMIRQASRSMASETDLAVRQFKEARGFWLTQS